MLPSTLKLVELRTVAALKSAHLYRFLSVARGRTLVFVNSINAVRRLSLLLEVLQIKAGALHARMQQRQRLKDRVATQALSMLLYQQYRTHGLLQAVHDAGASLHAPARRAPDIGEAAALQKMSTHQLL